MANVAFNIAKGQVAYYGSLPAATDSLIFVPLELSGLVSDATMIDYDTLDAALAGATNEQTTIGRKTLTTVTVTVDDTNDRVDIDCDDIAYTAPTGNAVGAALICYKPATASVDTAIIPLGKFDITWTPDGNDTNITIPTGGFARAS